MCNARNYNICIAAFLHKGMYILRPSLVSFLPTSFLSFSLSFFAVFFKVFTPVPGFTKLVTPRYAFEAQTFARLSRIIIILCFFFSDSATFYNLSPLSPTCLLVNLSRKSNHGSS